MKTIKNIFVALSLLAATSAYADEWALTTGFASKHFNKEPNSKYRENNYGLGLDYRLNDTWSLSTGYYRNSENRDGYYVTSSWTPWKEDLGSGWNFRFGIVGGVIAGYSDILIKPIVTPLIVFDNKNFIIRVTGYPPIDNKTGLIAVQFGIKL